jgi:hypothetical protein
MAAFNFHRRKTRRWWYAGATLVALAAFSVFFVVGASANIAPSTFQANDGNLIQEASPAGNTDWCNQLGTSLCPTANYAPNLTQQSDLTKSTSDNAFGQGSKEDNQMVTVVHGSIPPNKSDLSQFYTAHEKVGGDTFLYLAWERSNVLGNANMDFEVDQKATTFATGPVTINRTPGDLLFTYDFGGSGTPQLGLLVWLTGASTPTPVGGYTTNTCYSANSFPCWGDRVDLTAAGLAEGSINNTTVSDPIINKSLPAGTFGEMSVNLSLALPSVFGSNPTTCESLSSSFLTTRSSSSFTSEIKDFISPVATSIPNCGSLLIYKTDGSGNGLAGATFSATPGQTSTTGTATSTNFVDETGGYYCLDNMLLGQSTVVKETAAPAGYNVDPTSQTITVSSSDSCATRLAANPIVPDGSTFVDTPQVGAVVITKTGKDKSCTGPATPDASCAGTSSRYLGGAAFQLKSGSTVVATSGSTDITTGQVCIPNVAPGSYTLHESTTPNGYAAGADQTVTIVGGTTCASSPATASVDDKPLTTITVSTTPVVSGATTSTVQCVNSSTSGGTDTGETTPVATPHTTIDLVPGTYTCTVVIDP